MNYLLAAVLGVLAAVAAIRAARRPGAMVAAALIATVALACVYLASSGPR